MAEWITREAGVTVTPEEVAATAVPDHLRFNIRIVGLDGKVIAEGRDLVTVKRAARSQSSRSETAAADVATHRSWDFGTVPVEREVQRRGLHFTVFPTLRDCGDGVQLSDVPRASEADALLRSAVLRLVILAMPEQWKYARKRFADERDLILLAQGITVAKTLPERLAEKCFDECFFRGLGVLPRSAIEFQALLDQRRGSFGETVDRVGAHALDTLRELRAVRLKLGGLQGPAFAALNDQVHAQLARLVPETFPAGVHEALWPHLPRYMKALNRRLGKVAGNIKRDAELASKITAFGQAAEKLAKAPVAAALRPEFNQLQWMIEELRVSIFAQDLRTAIPVSEKRVADQVEKAKLEAERVA
jgi:ATP-dependent helicase HrpA